MVTRIEDAVELRWLRHSEKGAWLKLEAGPERWGERDASTRMGRRGQRHVRALITMLEVENGGMMTAENRKQHVTR